LIATEPGLASRMIAGFLDASRYHRQAARSV